MTEELEFIVTIKDSEEKFKQCIRAIEEGNCILNKEMHFQINNTQLSKCEFSTSAVVEYFLEREIFELTRFLSFFDKIRLMDEGGFDLYSYQIREWCDLNIITKYFDTLENEWELYEEKKVRNQQSLADEDLDKLKFICQIAIEHMKYGPSYDSVSANRYFDFVEQLKPTLVTQLKQHGSGQLSKKITEYSDLDLCCQANDVFGKINIQAQNNHQETYSKALNFINTLLKSDFPKSFAIEFDSPTKIVLDIPNLQLCGQHYLFAGAIKYPKLHYYILEYIQLSQKEFEWYSNLDDEDGATPSTFAVFSLVLNNKKYFSVLEQYLTVVDDAHQSIQQYLTPIFLQKYGVSSETIDLFLKLICSMQEHPPHPSFIHYFQNKQNLELLLATKVRYDDYEWRYVLYSIFGDDGDLDCLEEQFSPELWQIYLIIKAERDEFDK